ncbi:YitT family protein [Fructobacillus fructosus]|nr:YitT family protein [Fructobacillus fructosus]MBD9367025.1 YitT family protein [Leuconostoc mesenteroides]
MKKTIKICYLLLGLSIIGISASLLRETGLGVDPFTAFSIGLSTNLNIPLSITQILVNLIIFLYMLISDKNRIGIGTVLNMTLVGVFIQIFSQLLLSYHLSRLETFPKIFILLVGLLLFTLGSAIYMSVNMGQSPYDAVAPILSKQANLKYSNVRNFQDIIVVILAFIVHGPIGLGTVVIALEAGSLISKWYSIIPKIE